MKKSRTIYCDGVHLWRRLQPLELNPATSNWQLWPIAQLPNSVHCLQALYAAPTQSTSFVRCTHTVYKLCTLYPHCLQALYAVPRLSTSLKAPSPWLWVPRGPDFPLLRDPFHKADAPYIPLPPTHPWQEPTLQKPTPKSSLIKAIEMTDGWRLLVWELDVCTLFLCGQLPLPATPFVDNCPCRPHPCEISQYYDYCMGASYSCNHGQDIKLVTKMTEMIRNVRSNVHISIAVSKIVFYPTNNTL